MIYDAVTSFLGDDNLRFWHKNFMLYGNPANPYNIEAYPAGERIILTADPENIKAVLATQFHEFGKGKQFNDEWHGFLGDSKMSRHRAPKSCAHNPLQVSSPPMASSGPILVN